MTHRVKALHAVDEQSDLNGLVAIFDP
jgi:hypothetical protein